MICYNRAAGGAAGPLVQQPARWCSSRPPPGPRQALQPHRRGGGAHHAQRLPRRQHQARVQRRRLLNQLLHCQTLFQRITRQEQLGVRDARQRRCQVRRGAAREREPAQSGRCAWAATAGAWVWRRQRPGACMHTSAWLRLGACARAPAALPSAAGPPDHGELEPQLMHAVQTQHTVVLAQVKRAARHHASVQVHIVLHGGSQRLLLQRAWGSSPAGQQPTATTASSSSGTGLLALRQPPAQATPARCCPWRAPTTAQRWRSRGGRCWRGAAGTRTAAAARGAHRCRLPAASGAETAGVGSVRPLLVGIALQGALVGIALRAARLMRGVVSEAHASTSSSHHSSCSIRSTVPPAGRSSSERLRLPSSSLKPTARTVCSMPARPLCVRLLKRTGVGCPRQVKAAPSTASSHPPSSSLLPPPAACAAGACSQRAAPRVALSSAGRGLRACTARAGAAAVCVASARPAWSTRRMPGRQAGPLSRHASPGAHLFLTPQHL